MTACQYCKKSIQAKQKSSHEESCPEGRVTCEYCETKVLTTEMSTHTENCLNTQVTASPVHWNIVATGGGSSEYNGKYPSGQYWEHPGSRYLHFNNDSSYVTQGWLIGSSSSNVYYNHPSTAKIPPTSGWQTSKGQAPAPTLKFVHEVWTSQD